MSHRLRRLVIAVLRLLRVQCYAECEQPPFVWQCTHRIGHKGPHESFNGITWGLDPDGNLWARNWQGKPLTVTEVEE